MPHFVPHGNAEGIGLGGPPLARHVVPDEPTIEIESGDMRVRGGLDVLREPNFADEGLRPICHSAEH